jgi:hypothetical protein
MMMMFTYSLHSAEAFRILSWVTAYTRRRGFIPYIVFCSHYPMPLSLFCFPVYPIISNLLIVSSEYLDRMRSHRRCSHEFVTVEMIIIAVRNTEDMEKSTLHLYLKGSI